MANEPGVNNEVRMAAGWSVEIFGRRRQDVTITLPSPSRRGMFLFREYPARLLLVGVVWHLDGGSKADAVPHELTTRGPHRIDFDLDRYVVGVDFTIENEEPLPVLSVGSLVAVAADARTLRRMRP